MTENSEEKTEPNLSERRLLLLAAIRKELHDSPALYNIKTVIIGENNMEDEERQIKSITYLSEMGNQHVLISGQNVDRIEQITKNGEYAEIPWVEVYKDGKIYAEFNQHKLENIFYA